MHRKYLVIFLSILVLSSLFAVTALADDPSGEGGAGTGTDVLTDLTSGWYDSDYGYKTGYSNSWFWQLLLKVRGIASNLNDLKTGWTSSLYPTGYSGSWFQQVLVALRAIPSGSSSWTSSQATSVTSDVDSIQSDVSTSKSTLSQILTAINNLGSSNWTATKVNNVVSDVDTIATKTTDARNYLQNMSVDLSSIESDVSDSKTLLNTISTKIESLRTYVYNIRSYVSDIKTVIASSNAVTAHNNQVSNAGAVVTDFLSGSSSSSSLGVSDVHGIKNVVGLGDTYLSSSASISDAPDAFASAFSSSGGLGFWSQEVADELNGVQPSQRGGVDPVEPEIVTHYYEDNQKVVFDFFNRGGDQR